MTKLTTKKQPVNSQLQLNYNALKIENLKLQKQIAKLEAKIVTLSSKITILEKNTNDRCIHKNLPIECIKEKRMQTKEQLEQLKKEREKITNVST